jgi:hypothetical protein
MFKCQQALRLVEHVPCLIISFDSERLLSSGLVIKYVSIFAISVIFKQML